MIISNKHFVFFVRNANTFLGLFLLCFIIIGILSEKIPVQNGLGWDGNAFGKAIMNFDETGRFGTRPYNIHRMLPFVLVWVASKILQFSLVPETIVSSFLVLNSALLLIAFYYWTKICTFFKLNLKIRLLTFTGIFLNYAILKMTFYYPVLTDTMAFTLGMASFFYYLKSDNAKLLCCILLGAYTFPTFLYIGIIFFLFPYSVKVTLNKKPGLLNWVIIFAVPLIYGALTYTAFHISTEFLEYQVTPINLNLLPISIAVTILYLFLVTSMFQRFNLLSLLRIRVSFLRILFVIIGFSLIKWSTFLLADIENIFGLGKFILNIFNQSLTNPLIFLESHILYFSPVLLFLFLNFKTFTKTVLTQGLGTLVFVYLYLLLFIGSESRQFINALPVFMCLIGLSLKGKKPGWKLLSGLTILALVYSRFWYQINKEAFTGSLLEFPWQRYFMSQGPWMSHEMYFIFLAIITGSGGLFYLIFRKDLQALFTSNYKKGKVITPAEELYTNPS